MGGLAIVFIAISCGIPTGLIGRAKGGSFILWFVIGTCLPGFGLLAVILPWVAGPLRLTGRVR